ncbi:MAG: NAD(+) synthase [Pirellulales bacterium]
MRLVRIAAVALNQTPLDWAGNRRRIEHAIESARDAGTSVVCLPELCITGYGCEDMFLAPGVQRTALDSLVDLIPASKGIIVAVGLPVFHESGLYNAAALLCDGELLGLVGKQFLAGDGIHYEPRWFHRWPAGVVSHLEIADRFYPFGDLLFDCGGVRIGFEICRDAWVADRPGKRLADRGADILLNPSASHFSFGKQEIRERFVVEGSRTFCTSFVFCNLLGNEAGRAIFDGATLIASQGRMVARGPRLLFADEIVTTADVDIDATRRLRSQSFDIGEAASGIGLVEIGYAWPDLPASDVTQAAAAIGWEISPHYKHEAFARSVALALYDYLRKSHSQGFVISASGGADSSAVAVLVWLMVRLGVEELGVDGFLAKLGIERIAKAVGNADVARSIVQQLLTCVYQATRNSSDATRTAAETVAGAIGADFLAWNIDTLVDDYVATVSKAVGRELTWKTDDVALQNIQARVRGPAAWLVANLKNALLLATGNRSEAATGYATMDGDTCGGLAPIAGVDKAFLREWLLWIQHEGPLGIGPLPDLRLVNDLVPSAELRPPGANQTDEGDLMPYIVLDAIERAAIHSKQMPVDVYRLMHAKFPEYPAEQIGAWVERFFELWSRSQWKRERFAVAFHVDEANVDPKTWCRFPILNSGFESELEELRKEMTNDE